MLDANGECCRSCAAIGTYGLKCRPAVCKPLEGMHKALLLHLLKVLLVCLQLCTILGDAIDAWKEQDLLAQGLSLSQAKASSKVL